jgi:hypothetical protein
MGEPQPGPSQLTHNGSCTATRTTGSNGRQMASGSHMLCLPRVDGNGSVQDQPNRAAAFLALSHILSQPGVDSVPHLSHSHEKKAGICMQRHQASWKLPLSLSKKRRQQATNERMTTACSRRLSLLSLLAGHSCIRLK